MEALLLAVELQYVAESSVVGVAEPSVVGVRMSPIVVADAGDKMQLGSIRLLLVTAQK
jgi:hypothetical protein